MEQFFTSIGRLGNNMAKRTTYPLLLLSLPLLLFLVTALPCMAATYCVRPDSGGIYGAGDGSDWSNAFSGMPPYTSSFWTSRLAPGDVILVAGSKIDGRYNNRWRIQCGGTGDDLRVTIRRATSTEAMAIPGWQDAFDSQVVLSNSIEIWDFDFITVDGVTPNGIKIIAGSPHRINLSPDNNHPSSGITLRFLEIVGPGMDTRSGIRGINDTPVSSISAEHRGPLVEYCNIHDFSSACVKIHANTSGTIFQHNRIYNARDPVNHEDLIKITDSRGVVIRRNLFYNTAAAGVAFDNEFTFNDACDIYGNIFYQTGAFRQTGNFIECQKTTKNLKVYNNTFAYGRHALDSTLRTSPSNVISYNNIFFNNYAHFLSDGTADIHDYNWYSGNPGLFTPSEEHGIIAVTEDPFISAKVYNFALKAGSSAAGAGTILGAPYEKDVFLHLRSDTEMWDMGAVESSTAPPLPPTNLLVQ